MIEVPTHIAEVAAFPDRARVTRRGVVTLEAGPHRLAVTQLPLTLDPASVRASGKFAGSAPGGQARLLGVDVQKAFFQDTPAEAVKALEDQIQALEDGDKALADEAETLSAQMLLARSIAEKAGEHVARGVAFARADLAQGKALMEFVAQELARAQDGLRALGVQRRDLARQLEQLRNQLKTLQASRGRERYTASLEVEVSAAGELSVELGYVVAQAGWQPLYDVRLADRAVDLTYLGQVTQRTGEDWDRVGLALSTARPALAAVLPELKPWYIGAPAPPRAVKMAKAGLQEAAPAPAMLFAGELVEMEAATADVEDAGSAVSFRLAHTTSIPADGQSHKVSVATRQLEPRLDYVTTPRLAEFAYRRARLTNAADLTLLPGQASLFVEGDFVGTTALKRVAPGEDFELYLGVDDRIYVKRELTAREVDKKLLQDRRRVRFAYEIELRNLRDERIELEVHDQLPVSRHESIKVKLESAEPRPAEHSDMNELTWRLALDAGAQHAVRFDFSVEHPRELQVAGLP